MWWLLNFTHPFTIMYLGIMGVYVAQVLKKQGFKLSDSFGLSVWWLQIIIHPNGFMWHFTYHLSWNTGDLFFDPWQFMLGIEVFLLAVFFLKKYKVTKLLVVDRWVLLIYVVDIIFHVWWIGVWAHSYQDISWQAAYFGGPTQIFRNFIVNDLAAKSIQTCLFVAFWRRHMPKSWRKLFWA